MYELKGEIRTLSGSGKKGRYWEHRYNYVHGFIRNRRDIQDLHEWSKEYRDDTITTFTEIDLNFKREKNYLKRGTYDDNYAMHTYIQEVSRLYRNKFLYNSIEKLIKKSVRRTEQGVLAKNAPCVPQSIPNFGFHIDVSRDGKYELPSGDKDTYISFCSRAWNQEITDRDDLKALIEIAKSKGDSEKPILKNLTTIYWYDEMAAAFMNGLLCTAYVADRSIISRINLIADCKKDKPVLDRYEGERILKFSGVNWKGEKPIEEWNAFEDENVLDNR